MTVGVDAPDVLEGLFQRDPVRLLAGRCRACGALRFPAAPLCAHCQADDVEQFPLADRGTLYTFTIVRARPPGYGGPVPYAVGVVTLPDGIRVAATLMADDLEALAIDDEVRLELVTVPDATTGGAVTSYAFRRAEAEA